MKPRKRQRSTMVYCHAGMLLGISLASFPTGAFAGFEGMIISEKDEPLLFQGWVNLKAQQKGGIPFTGYAWDHWYVLIPLYDFTDPPDTVSDGLQVFGFHDTNPHFPETHSQRLESEVIGDVFPPDEPSGGFPFIITPVFVIHPGPENHKDKLEARLDSVFVGGVEKTRLSIQMSHQLSNGQHPPILSGPLGPHDNCPPTSLCDDCNKNGIQDAQDIIASTSQDCNENGFPDECEGDCDRNGIADDCEAIDTGACNGSLGCFETSQCLCQRTGIGTYQGNGTVCPLEPSVPTIGRFSLAGMVGAVFCMMLMVFRRQWKYEP
jgi:hypothetical protein